MYSRRVEWCVGARAAQGRKLARWSKVQEVIDRRHVYINHNRRNTGISGTGTDHKQTVREEFVEIYGL